MYQDYGVTVSVRLIAANLGHCSHFALVPLIGERRKYFLRSAIVKVEVKKGERD